MAVRRGDVLEGHVLVDRNSPQVDHVPGHLLALDVSDDSVGHMVEGDVPDQEHSGVDVLKDAASHDHRALNNRPEQQGAGYLGVEFLKKAVLHLYTGRDEFNGVHCVVDVSECGVLHLDVGSVPVHQFVCVLEERIEDLKLRFS